MRLLTYKRKSLRFHRWTNLAVGLGVVTGTAALTGALVVGDSMRASLRALAVGRLGPVDHALVSSRFFRERLASAIVNSEGFSQRFATACPAIVLRGGVVHAESQSRVEHVNVLGVDERFWALTDAPRTVGFPGAPGRAASPTSTSRYVILNETLSTELAVKVGDDLILRIARPSAISTETLLGRRDDVIASQRLRVHSVAVAGGMSTFALRPQHRTPRNVFVPLHTLQGMLGQPGRVNAILVAGRSGISAWSVADAAALQGYLDQHVELADIGLTLRRDEMRGYVALESERFLLEPPVEEAGRVAALAIRAPVSSILAYLANSISAGPGDALSAGATPSNEPPQAAPPDGSPAPPAARSVIPYSTVAALDAAAVTEAGFTLVDGTPAPPLEAGEILLNEWAADELHIAPGEPINLEYYVTGPFGQLETRRHTFKLRGVLRLSGGANDPGFTPEYPGVTDARNLSDWDPPFPVNLKLIRDQDEAYWDRYRTCPKAFVSLAEGVTLWAEQDQRFGRLTSLRLTPPAGMDPASTAEAFERELGSRLKAGRLGLQFEPVKQQALTGSTGSTDFGGLFIGFSFFLILSAAMLVALLFRLSVERRSGEIGLLLSLGYAPRVVTRLFLLEGAAIAGVGGVLGLVGAVGYGRLMLAGLQSWWSDAVHAPFLHVHITPASMLLGYALSFLTAVTAIAWSIRGLSRLPPRSLLAGTIHTGRPTRAAGTKHWSVPIALCAFAVSAGFVVLSAVTDAVAEPLAFFGGGVAMLVALLAVVVRVLAGRRFETIRPAGLTALLRLGLRNATRNPRRSILTIALISSSSFVIISLQAFRVEVDSTDVGTHSGTGGFTLYAESAVPLPFDLNTPQGRESLSVIEFPMGALQGVTVMPFRLRTGDESSCLNLYRPTSPRIIGATDAMIRRGGFAFSSTLPINTEGLNNPWRLLGHVFPDGAIPVIGDESAVKWQLHLGLGKDLMMTDERGRHVRLRFVALLKGSVLQNELIVAESQLVTLFPSVTGYGFFLLDTPRDRARPVAAMLERELGPYGFDADLTATRLTDYLAVQNTYLSTFQTLGGLGLIVGTIGMGAVLLRNVWERRGELALMRAVGFSRRALGWIVLAENGVLMAVGLLSGTIPAMVAIAPHIADRSASVPWLSMSLTLAGVFTVGMMAGVVAVVPALRSPLLPALRIE